MRAIRDIDGTLTWVMHRAPEPGPGEVRIAVRATAVNRADLVQRAGRYSPPPGATDILGLECSGVVESVGEGVLERAVGDEVIALLVGGGYAELVTCPASHTLLRGELSWTDAGAVMEVFATAWLNLKREAGLQEGEKVLLHAAASGVGTAALQLCRSWGNPVFATVGGAEKEVRCRALGASETHDRHSGSFLPAVKAWGGADVVLCPVGGSYLNDNLLALRPRGRLVIIGLMGGRDGTMPLGPLLMKRLAMKGSVLRSRSVAEKNTVIEGLQREVWPLWMSGELKPVVERTFPIEHAEAAHALVASNQTVGKVVLQVSS